MKECPECEEGAENVKSAGIPTQPSRLCADFDAIANKNYDSIEISSTLGEAVTIEDRTDITANPIGYPVENRYAPTCANLVINNNAADNTLGFFTAPDILFDTDAQFGCWSPYVDPVNEGDPSGSDYD